MRRLPLAVLALGLVTSAHAAEPPFQELARTTFGAEQGVVVIAEDGRVLASQAAARAVHPASVTKIATTLALLARLGPAHRFTTHLVAGGPIDDGTLVGDLVVEAGGDPFLVTESAFLMLRRLHALGLRTVDGGLTVRGPLVFNWERDPTGARLARVLAGRDGATAWSSAHDGRPPRTLAEAALTFRSHPAVSPPRPSPGRDDPGGSAAAGHPLVVHRSPPLVHVIKVLNGYSNNVFDLAAGALGGPAAVEAFARAQVPAAMRDEIVIDNAAGAGTTNRMSPRAAVALLEALAREVARHGHTLADVLPVSGIDPGTLERRLRESPAGPAILVGKTGTYGSEGACALAGALRTRRYGVVTFAILNHGLAVPVARARQDAFVAALVARSDARPWPYAAPTRPDFAAALVE